MTTGPLVKNRFQGHPIRRPSVVRRLVVSALFVTAVSWTGSVALAQSKCDATQMNAYAKYFSCAMKVVGKSFKKGDPVDEAKLAACLTSALSSCVKGEKKGDCSLLVLCNEIAFTSDSFIDDIRVDTSADVPAGSTSKCRAKFLKSLGKDATCLLKTYAKALKAGETAGDPVALSKCATKRLTGCAKAAAKGDCFTAGSESFCQDLAPAYGWDYVDGFVEQVASTYSITTGILP